MVKLDGKELSMELDTGASLSLISETIYKKLWGSDTLPELQQTTVKFRTYIGEETGPKISTLPNSDSGCEAALPEVPTGNAFVTFQRFTNTR